MQSNNYKTKFQAPNLWLKFAFGGLRLSPPESAWVRLSPADSATVRLCLLENRILADSARLWRTEKLHYSPPTSATVRENPAESSRLFQVCLAHKKSATVRGSPPLQSAKTHADCSGPRRSVADYIGHIEKHSKIIYLQVKKIRQSPLKWSCLAEYGGLWRIMDLIQIKHCKYSPHSAKTSKNMTDCLKT